MIFLEFSTHNVTDWLYSSFKSESDSYVHTHKNHMSENFTVNSVHKLSNSNTVQSSQSNHVLKYSKT